MPRATKREEMIIAVDFDGTIVTHDYPIIGQLIPQAIQTLHDLIASGHKLILYTMRSDRELVDAVDYCRANSIELWAVNKNPTQTEWTSSPKIFANLYIDDAAVGCPLVVGAHRRPYVDWVKIREMLTPMFKEKGAADVAVQKEK